MVEATGTSEGSGRHNGFSFGVCIRLALQAHVATCLNSLAETGVAHPMRAPYAHACFGGCFGRVWGEFWEVSGGIFGGFGEVKT